MKTKNALRGVSIAVVLQLGVLDGSAQTNKYLFSGSETNITLNPGAYIITAYGAPGGGYNGGLGAEMSSEFNFSASTALTLLVGGSTPFITSGGGGGGSFVVEGSTPLVIAGGGGGDNGGSGVGANGNIGTNGVGAQDGDSTGGTGGFGGGPGNSPSGGGGGGGGGFQGNGGTSAVYYDFNNRDNYYGGGGFSFENGGSGGSSGEGFYFVGGFGGGGGAFPGGGSGGGGYSGGGGGGVAGGGGGGSIIDSSAIAILAEVSGIASPDDPPNFDQNYLGNGEIIITAVPTPLVITTGAAFGFTNGVFGFNLIGPSGSNVVIQASTDLQTWFPLQANLLGSGPLYFSDTNAPANVRRFYRAACAYTVGGSLTGLLAGDIVTLQDNGTDNLTLSNNGTFTFPTALPNGHAYSVTISGTSGVVPASCALTNDNGTISGANVTNVAVQCMPTGACPALTGIMDEDMYNAAVSDGTANGGVPGVMFTSLGGPFRVTAIGTCSENVAETYNYWAWFDITVGSNSCSSTTFPSGTPVIAFGNLAGCGVIPYDY